MDETPSEIICKFARIPFLFHSKKMMQAASQNEARSVNDRFEWSTAIMVLVSFTKQKNKLILLLIRASQPGSIKA